MLGLDNRDWSSLYPLCKLVYVDKQVRIAPGRPLEGSNQIEPLDHERPCDGYHLECLGLPSVVLTPFTGVHNLFSIGYCGWPVKDLSECVSDQGPRCSMVLANPTMDITQQLFPLFDGDAVQ